MSKHTVLFNGFAVCHTDDPTIADEVDGTVAVPYSKNYPPLEVNGKRNTIKDDTWIDEFNFVD